MHYLQQWTYGKNIHRIHDSWEGGGDIPVVSIIAEQIQGDGNLIRSRRRGGAPGGGGGGVNRAAQVPGFDDEWGRRWWGWRRRRFSGGFSISYNVYKKTMLVRRFMLIRMCEIKFQYINIITHKSRGEVSTCPFDRIKH